MSKAHAYKFLVEASALASREKSMSDKVRTKKIADYIRLAATELESPPNAKSQKAVVHLVFAGISLATLPFESSAMAKHTVWDEVWDDVQAAAELLRPPMSKARKRALRQR